MDLVFMYFIPLTQFVGDSRALAHRQNPQKQNSFLIIPIMLQL